jgi:hypothetical protein
MGDGRALFGTSRKRAVTYAVEVAGDAVYVGLRPAARSADWGTFLRPPV